MLRYWNRLITLKEDRLTKNVFNNDYANGGLWCSKIKSILESIDMDDEYTDKNIVDINMCKKKFMNVYAEKWKEQVFTKPKLCTYVNIKDTFVPEKYVTMNLSQQQRSILAQLRIGILPLVIETGRFINVKREDRICTLCTDNCIEDEIHFTLVCPFYNDVRKRFLEQIKSFQPYSLAGILKNLCENHPRQFAKYVTEIWMKRKNSLYL